MIKNSKLVLNDADVEILDKAWNIICAVQDFALENGGLKADVLDIDVTSSQLDDTLWTLSEIAGAMKIDGSIGLKEGE